MADWYGCARSNFFTPTNLEGLTAVVKQAGMKLTTSGLEDNPRPGKVCILAYDGWPSTVTDEETGAVTDWEFDKTIMPFVTEGEVVVTMETGAEKLRYMTGYAKAYQRKGSEVRHVQIDLNDIYKLAGLAFDVDPANITPAEY